MAKKKTSLNQDETLRELKDLSRRKDLTPAEKARLDQQIAETEQRKKLDDEMDRWVGEEMERERIREENGGMLGESYARQMTPEEELAALRDLDEEIETEAEGGRPESAEQSVTVTVTLPALEAAALKRLCDKVGHTDALAYLYPHVSKAIRDDQAYDVLHGAARVSEALCTAGVSDWPWVETRATK